LAGREFDESDDHSAESRLIVNETFAGRFWGSPAAALGRSVETADAHRTIVGVVRDIKYARLDETPRPYMYVPASQLYRASMTLQVRSRDEPTAVLARIRGHAAALDPSMTILQSGAMSDTLRSATSLYETLARMLTLVGLLAVAVATMGVYGLIAFSVKQQAHETGVRSALGAPRRTIVRHFLRQGLLLVAIGGAIGVAASIGTSRLMSALLFGVASSDATSFTMATLVVFTSAVLASLVPAWRAVSGNPIAVLRRQ
jgi:predicted lysophospholipase L1 biosynthesis ABC-type transport system permease subunit